MSTPQNTCRVTVLLPVYNAAPFLRQAIDSILAQTFKDFELLTINDGSTDESRNIILSYSDERIRLLDNPKNIGLIATLNRGIHEAKGKYIARMDADDVALSDRLYIQLKQMEEDPSIDVIASMIDFINTDGEITGMWNTDRLAVTPQEIRQMMMRTNCIAHPTVVMKTEVAREFLYNEKQKGAEDWDLWMRMLAAGRKIAKVPIALLRYRVHAESITAVDKREEVLEKRLIRVKCKFLWSQFVRLRLNSFFWGVKFSAMKNFARHIVSNKLPDWGRDIKRFLFSPPWKVIGQGKKFRAVIEKNNGRHYFIFPYMHMGGAEKVHAAIVETVSDQKPVVIFSGFSDNDNFLERFTRNATVLDAAHYINYPLTRKKAKRLLAEKLNSNQSVIFGSNAGFFYDIIPLLNKQVKVIDLIHAFKYQPEANLAHRKYLPLASRINQRIFISEAARTEFSKFCFHHNIPVEIRSRLILISNAIPVPAEIPPHNDERKGVLFVGRDSAEKRLHLFIGIADRFQKMQPGNLRFTVVGTNSSQSLSHITFAGEVTSDAALELIYQDHDFLVVTSSREGFPVVIMEAMANGLVVIATPVGDIPNRLHGKNGIVLASTDENAVVQQTFEIITELLASPEKMKSIREEARRYAIENFNPDRFRSEYRKVLEVG